MQTLYFGLKSKNIRSDFRNAHKMEIEKRDLSKYIFRTATDKNYRLSHQVRIVSASALNPALFP